MIFKKYESFLSTIKTVLSCIRSTMQYYQPFKKSDILLPLSGYNMVGIGLLNEIKLLQIPMVSKFPEYLFPKHPCGYTSIKICISYHIKQRSREFYQRHISAKYLKYHFVLISSHNLLVKEN